MKGSFNIGDWLVEPSLNRLSRDETAIQLELKLMDLLVFLAQRKGEVASKEEIIDSVWHAEFIAENTLTHSIADLRRALGDNARSPVFIETIPKRGYRVLAPISGSEITHPSPEPCNSQLKLVTVSREYLLLEGANLIGRADSADVCIGTHGASREHARITVQRERAMIEDLGSKNGTFLNGETLTSIAELRHGDEIHIGRRLAVFRFVVEGRRTLTETID